MSQPPQASRFTPAAPSRPAPAPPTPVDLAAHARHMRRWTFMMVGGALLLAVVFIGVQLFLMKGISKHHDNEADKQQPPAWTTQTTSGLGKPFSASRERPTVTQKTQDETLLSVIGNLEGAHLYQTFLNIGLLADARGKDVYSPQQAAELLDAINLFIDNAAEQLANVPPSSYPTDVDRKEMELAGIVTTLLRRQTRELKAYWDTGDPVHEQSFQKARSEAWEKIKIIAHVQE